jgi:diaminohydroxyphosphoribosylaminopyrimidine deaminase/5-amino-6-(5-phosphoribosylamino)uracil reductase
VRGATAYVTLEPCAHQGRTGPCCDALIAAGIGKVVASLEDPNPLVAGQGFARLRAQPEWPWRWGRVLPHHGN